MENLLAKKLLIRSESRILMRNAPDDFAERLNPLPEGAKISTSGIGPFDVILLFVRNKAEVDTLAIASIEAAAEKSAVWIIYPKRSKKMETDINRDTGWDVLWTSGWSGISIAAIDETWTALRFRPESKVKRKPDSIFLKKD